MGPALSCSLRWNCWRSWRLWSPRPGFISCVTTGSWRPGPGTASASCRPSRLPSRRRRDGSMRAAASCGHRRRWATLLARVFSSDISECAACGGRLRIIAARTDPASIRMLSGPASVSRPCPRRWPPAEGPAAAAVRVRRLTCLLDPSPSPGTAGCALNGPSGPGLIRIRADKRPNCTASSVEGLGNDPLRELPDPGGALSALTESPKSVPCIRLDAVAGLGRGARESAGDWPQHPWNP